MEMLTLCMQLTKLQKSVEIPSLMEQNGVTSHANEKRKTKLEESFIFEMRWEKITEKVKIKQKNG